MNSLTVPSQPFATHFEVTVGGELAVTHSSRRWGSVESFSGQSSCKGALLPSTPKPTHPGCRAPSYLMCRRDYRTRRWAHQIHPTCEFICQSLLAATGAVLSTFGRLYYALVPGVGGCHSLGSLERTHSPCSPK